MALSETDRIRLLEELAQDKDLKATQRLRALEELGKIESRRGIKKGAEVPKDEQADPMADMDELEVRRRRRAS